MEQNTVRLPPRPSGAEPRAARSPRWILLGLLAIAIGGLASVALYAKATDTQPVLVAANPIARGQVISDADLIAVELGSPVGLRWVGAERRSEVVGSTALVDVAAGTPVVPDGFGRPVVDAGTVTVGLRLVKGRLPSSPLPAGTPVHLVEVSAPSSLTGAAQATTGTTVPATIVRAPQTSPDGSADLVDVAVAADRVQVVAELAASERIVLVMVAR